MRKAIVKSLAALTCVVATGAAAAEIYKWTDADGRVHYSDAPPPNTRVEKVIIEQPIAIVPTAPVSPPSTPTAEQLADRDKEFRQRRAERVQAEQDNERREAAQREADRKGKCELAKRNLDQILTTRQRVVVAADGSIKVSDEPPLNRFHRPVAIGEQEELIKQYCD